MLRRQEQQSLMEAFSRRIGRGHAGNAPGGGSQGAGTAANAASGSQGRERGPRPSTSESARDNGAQAAASGLPLSDRVFLHAFRFHMCSMMLSACSCQKGSHLKCCQSSPPLTSLHRECACRVVCASKILALLFTPSMAYCWTTEGACLAGRLVVIHILPEDPRVSAEPPIAIYGSPRRDNALNGDKWHCSRQV